MTRRAADRGRDMADGRVPSEPGSREPSPSVSAASGFDPSRIMRDFYLSQYYDPAAVRPADNVLAAMEYIIDCHLSFSEEAELARDSAGFLGSVPDCIKCLSDELTEANKEICRLRSGLGEIAEEADNIADFEGIRFKAFAADILRGSNRKLWDEEPRDSDGNPEGEKPQALSAEHDSAGRKASHETGSAPEGDDSRGG